MAAGLKVPKSSGTVSVLHTASQTKLRLAAQISPTTAGRSPFNTPRIGPMLPYLKNTRARIIPRNREGVTNPTVAQMAPPRPAIFVPAKVAALMPIGPGVICEIVKISTNSLMESQWNVSTTEAWMSGIEAYPPPTQKMPTLQNSQNNCQ